MNGRSRSTLPVVKALATSARSRVWWGGSLASMVRATAGCGRRRDSAPAKKRAVSFDSRGSASASRASA